MIDNEDVAVVVGRDVVGPDGGKIGTAGQVFLDDRTGRPEWVTVTTGLLGTRQSFVPLAGAELRGDEVAVPYDKDRVKGAPSVDADEGHLSVDEEDQLFRYYGVAEGTAAAAGSGTADGGADLRARTAGRDLSGPETDDAMTRSEEEVHVGTERVQTGRARLRKWIETEQVDVPVTVTREKARLVTEPVTDANRDAALSGGDLTEEEHEVVLTEERPVVQKETVPVERVRLETETVQDQETVSTDVRTERIAAEGDLDDSTGRVSDR